MACLDEDGVAAPLVERAPRDPRGGGEQVLDAGRREGASSSTTSHAIRVEREGLAARTCEDYPGLGPLRRSRRRAMGLWRSRRVRPRGQLFV